MKKNKIGYTQGTFDMFHIGHLNLLHQAKELCEELIVGVNTDQLVSDYKHKMPVVNEHDRAAIIGELRCVDMVVWMPDAIYVFELKVNGTAQEALQQINSNNYAITYQTDGRQVVKVGVKFDAEKRIPQEWTIETN